jgi:large subunit ribosomal protein L6
MPITVPPGVVIDIKGNEVTVTGPKGKLCRRISPDMSITLSDNTLTVSRPSDSKEHSSRHGLTRSLLNNMVEGVSRGFEKNLELVGVGYRVEKKESVGEMAAEIRAIRPPDSYKGKGIRYLGETVRLKPGKSKQSTR